MTDEINAAPVTQSRELALLQTWFSPSFPIGSFAFSQGLESAVEAGMVRGEDTLLAWIADLFEFGSIQNDLILMASAWKATDAGRWADLLETAEFASALQPSAERHFEASVQGKSFLEAICAAWPSNGFAKALEACRDVPVVYAIAAGLASAAHGLRLGPSLEAFALAFAAAQVSAAIRLGSIGQTAGQRIIAALLPAIAAAAARASVATLDGCGTAAFSADLVTIEHETLYSRLFRT